MCSAKSWVANGAILAGLAVVIGAFAAHGLDGFVVEKYGDASPKTVAGFSVPASWKYLEDFKTGAEYQMYHALGMIVVGLLARGEARKSLQAAGWCFLLGIVFFSGSLYALTLTGETKLGMIAPIGGTLFIVGWVLLAIGACGCLSAKAPESDN
jgi:uncharacterized membrane protein YgdD (TMEM256/DUF423 family)